MRILSFALMLLLAVVTYTAQSVDEDTLRLYLPFDDGAGKNPKDVSGNGNQVSIKGDLKWVKGKINGALEFDGDAANFVEVAHTADLEGMKQLTVEAWVQPFGTDALARGIVSKRAAWQAGDVYNLFSWNESKFWARVNAKDGQQISSTSILEDKEWMHLAYVYDGKTKKQRLYVNGELENEVDHPEAEVSSGQEPLWIGTLNQGYAQTWNGLIDEVRIWSSVLTEDEIKLAMAGELLPVQPYGKATTTWARLKQP